ncbi:hypothetical protein A6J58_011695 [Pasteurella multocida]|nr:hypothetical protein A6J58_011695 [Pasteurella multocida]
MSAMPHNPTEAILCPPFTRKSVGKKIKIIKFILNTYKEDFFKLCIISNNLIKKQTKKTAHQRAVHCN